MNALYILYLVPYKEAYFCYQVDVGVDRVVRSGVCGWYFDRRVVAFYTL